MARKSDSETLEIAGREVTITNAAKLLFPAAKVTKLDVARYYIAVAEGALREWQELLKRPWQEVAARATELSDDAARLRQSSPLATLLSPAERRRVHDAFRA